MHAESILVSLRFTKYMAWQSGIELTGMILLVMAVSPPLGKLLASIYQGQTPRFLKFLSPLERIIYNLSGVNPQSSMTPFEYGKGLITLHLLGFLSLFLLLLFQGFLPMNPLGLSGVAPAQAFNITASFITNTNWQSYTPEITLSPLSQMVGLTVQNFLSAAIGFCVLVVLSRGIHNGKLMAIGNLWVDLTRSVLYILLPISFLLASLLIIEGTPQVWGRVETLTPLEGGSQAVLLGPVASQVAIKQIGTNGGGYYNANSAHPLENPTPLTDFLESWAILLLPAATPFLYGALTRRKKEAWILFGVMSALWLLSLIGSQIAEHGSNPIVGNEPFFEGKETRLGISRSAFWTTSTTATANGSTNASLSSASPLSSGLALFDILIGEVAFGGVGVGMVSLLFFTLLTVFLAGLMIGRTPEYLGKRVEQKEMFWVLLSLLSHAGLILVGSAFIILYADGGALSIRGHHGLTEALYAAASSVANNGSSFAGIHADWPVVEVLLGCLMLIGRFIILLPAIMVAHSLCQKQKLALGPGSFRTDTPLFGFLLFIVILFVGALTFFPGLALGPVVENFLMQSGRVFG